MLRPPSNLRPYDDFYSGDTALLQPPDDATKEQREEHARKLRVAREIGDWSALRVDGQQPTRFGMRLLTGTQRRWLIDQASREDEHKLGAATLFQLAFRCAVIDIDHLDGFKVSFEDHPSLGRIATEAVADHCDSFTPRIVGELGAEAWRRATELSPK